MSDNNSSSSGIGFTSLLLVAFIVLKLCNVITWSWWWVLSPAWIAASLVVLLLIVYCILEYRKAVDETKRELSGMNEEAWKKGGKSKWEERLEEMKAKQKAS